MNIQSERSFSVLSVLRRHDRNRTRIPESGSTVDWASGSIYTAGGLFSFGLIACLSVSCLRVWFNKYFQNILSCQTDSFRSAAFFIFQSPSNVREFTVLLIIPNIYDKVVEIDSSYEWLVSYSGITGRHLSYRLIVGKPQFSAHHGITVCIHSMYSSPFLTLPICFNFNNIF